MIQRPQLAPGFHAEAVAEEEEVIILLSEQETQLLRGRPYRMVVPLLDGRHTVPELIAKLSEQVSAPEVYYAVMSLSERGYVIEADESSPEPAAAFWQVQHVNAQDATARLAASRVSLNSVGSVSTASLKAALEALNIAVGEDGVLDVVVTDDYLHAELEVINRRALETKRPWMLIKPVGLELWLGPILRPYETGCWTCLAQRLQDNRPVEMWLKGQVTHTAALPAMSRAALTSSTQIAVHMAATAIAQWLATGDFTALGGQVLTVDVRTLETRSHVLVRRPQCTACGKPLPCTETLMPLELEPRPKGFVSDGGHRHVSPNETWMRYRHHVSPITGVVPNLWRPSDADDEIAPVYLAPTAWRPAASLAGVRSGLRHCNSGKGKTEQQSRVSGLCEALERYCGTFQGDEPRQTAPYEALGEEAIHPADCLLFSETQYRERRAWNARHSAFNHVSDPFDARRPIEWTPVWSMSHQRVRYVPTAFCYYRYPFPRDHRFCRVDSNGNAAGNTLEEAILQGFLELVERDSVALWWYNQVQRPAVDLASFTEPYFQAFEAYYAKRNRQVWVLDLTSDLSIPVFAAVSGCTDGSGEKLVFGFGAHVEARVGIERAMTEMTQGLEYFAQAEQSAADSEADAEQREALAWWQTATLAQQSYLTPHAHLPAKTAADYPQLWSEDLREDVERCVSLVASRGLETLVLDQTRPDIGLSVVKVIVPGMRHFWRRLAPGRLYDVPVELGWLPSPLREHELNPISMFL